MVYEKIMEVLRNDSAQLAQRVVQDLFERSETEFHTKFSKDIVYERVYDVYSTLSYWLDAARSNEEIRKHFLEMGKKRFKEGLPMHELIMFHMLIKRNLWLYLLEKHFFESTYELMKGLELNNRIVLFFDRAIVASVMGYEEEMFEHVKSSSEGLLHRFFSKKNK